MINTIQAMPRQVKSAKAACNGTTKDLNLTRTCFLSNGDSGRGAPGLSLSSRLSGRNGAIIPQLAETLHAVQGYGNQGLAVKTAGTCTWIRLWRKGNPGRRRQLTDRDRRTLQDDC